MRYKFIILDRDGVLNEIPTRNRYVLNENEIVLKHEVIRNVVELQHQGVDFCVATNQKGIGLGLISVRDLESIHDKLNTGLVDKGGKPIAFYVCSHIEGSCDCRKPKPGLLLKAMADFNVSPAETLFIGDMLSDLLAAKNAYIDFMYVHNFTLMNLMSSKNIFKHYSEYLI